MRNTLYNLIRNNRNNETQRIQIGVTERFSKPEEILNNKRFSRSNNLYDI